MLQIIDLGEFLRWTSNAVSSHSKTDHTKRHGSQLSGKKPTMFTGKIQNSKTNGLPRHKLVHLRLFLHSQCPGMVVGKPHPVSVAFGYHFLAC